jgi:hypothetical protein
MSGLDEVVSWADGTQALWRLFEQDAGKQLVLQLSSRASIATSQAFYQLKGSPTNVPQTGVTEGAWLQDAKLAVAPAQSFPGGGMDTFFNDNQGIGTCWWDETIPLVTQAIQLQPFADDVLYDTITNLTLSTGSGTSGTYTLTSGVLTSNVLNLTPIFNQGDLSQGQFVVEMDLTLSVLAPVGEYYIAVALTAGIGMAPATITAVDPNTGPSAGQLQGLILIGPLWATQNAVHVTTALCVDLPGLSPAGSIQLPFNADQLSVGIMAINDNGSTLTMSSTPLTAVAYASRRSQQAIGVAPRLA